MGDILAGSINALSSGPAIMNNPRSERPLSPRKKGLSAQQASSGAATGGEGAHEAASAGSLVNDEALFLANLPVIFLDYRNRLWGKWRPSAEAKRLGPTAILIERLVARDGWAVDQVIEMVRVNHRVIVEFIYPNKNR
jgi:hypothetical protein